MNDKTSTRSFAKKKTYSVSAADLEVTDFKGTEAITVFNIPEKSLVTTVRFVTEKAGDASLTMLVKVGTSTAIGTATASTANNSVKSTAAYKVLTGSGKAVTVTPSIAVTKGNFVLTVEYIEYTLNNGALTNYS